MKCGVRTVPRVMASDLSFFRSGFPKVKVWIVRSFAFEWKFEGTPAAAQFFALVAGSGPLLTRFSSQTSVAKPNALDVGLNASVIDGARTARVYAPRNAMSRKGA